MAATATKNPTINFFDLLKRGRFTASLIADCIRDTGLKGRTICGVRLWTEDEAKLICDLATSTLDGTRYA